MAPAVVKVYVLYPFAQRRPGRMRKPVDTRASKVDFPVLLKAPARAPKGGAPLFSDLFKSYSRSTTLLQKQPAAKTIQSHRDAYEGASTICQPSLLRHRVKSPKGISPSGPHRSARESPDSCGSCRSDRLQSPLPVSQDRPFSRNLVQPSQGVDQPPVVS